MRMAEFRAAEDSLNRLYLTREPAERTRLPTDAFSSTFSMRALAEIRDGAAEYVAPAMGEAEVLYASAGRSGVRMRAGPAADVRPGQIDIEREVQAQKEQARKEEL